MCNGDTSRAPLLEDLLQVWLFLQRVIATRSLTTFRTRM